MNKVKLACLVACITLCLAMFGGLVNQRAIVGAEEPTSLPEEKVELSCKFPELSGEAEQYFKFDVQLSYEGGEQKKLFDFYTEGPPDWVIDVRSGAYGETEKIIPSIYLDPEKGYAEQIAVVARGVPWRLPEPGEYTIRLKVAEDSSGEPKDSIEFKVMVTGRSDFMVQTTSGRLNIKAKAGESSYLPIIVTNIGTTVLDKVTFSSSKPTGVGGEEWSITFKPEKIESLSPGSSEEVEVVVKPPSKTIAGDYPVTLNFDSEPKSSVNAPPKLEIRVAVSTPSHWGWIGLGIVIAVIAGLVVGFRQLGRR